ncbi:MAG: TadE/TadG family type IV pilus assembly protein [Acidimicrobiia bacterium]
MTTETVILLPAVVLFIMAALQFALYYHSANVATAAAQDAMRAARVERGSVGAGEARGHEVLAQAAGSVFDDVGVSVSRGDRSVRVVVTGSVASLIPGVDLRVTRVSQGAIEEFLAPERR